LTENSQSVGKRYLFTVIASLFRALLGFITGMLLARFLGPNEYGSMSFLLGTFLAFRQLLDMGSAQAFFTFVSQRLRSREFIRYYFLWLFFQCIFTIILIGLIFPSNWVDFIWHGEHRGMIILAFCASFMQNSLWASVQQLLEAQRQTYRAQSIGTLIVVFHISAVLLLWILGKLGIYIIFIALIFEFLAATFVAKRFFRFDETIISVKKKVERKEMYYLFKKFCTPLIFYSWISFFYSFVDTWLLQNFGGSVKQAYYSVSSQFASVALLATSSITNIFYKEVAEAYHKGNVDKVRYVYKKVSRSLYFIGAIISCFFIPWSKDIIQIILGSAYIGGSGTLAIMFLYPIHQSMGQIANSILFATEHVKVQVKIGIFFMLLSVIVTYFVLASQDSILGGLNLGSEGLALKMFLLQIFQVNVLSYAIAKTFNWKFDWLFQPIIILVCFGIGWLSHFLVIISSIPNHFPIAVVILIGGVVYILMTLIFIIIVPSLTGFTRTEIIARSKKILRSIHFN
jgi:O-antigen/teichoic acid export membrane protein